MKIILAIDIRPLVGPLIGPLAGAKTGIGEYVERLCSALDDHEDVQVVRFSNSLKSARTLPLLVHSPRVHMRFPNRALDLAVRFFSVPKFDDIVAAKTRIQPHVWLSPHIISAPLRTARKIVIVHDCSFLFPHFFSLRKRYWHWSMNIAKTLADAEVIVAVSEHTKQELRAHFPHISTTIRVIPPGIDPLFLSDPSPHDHAPIRTRYRLPEHFILFLGTIEPRKNIRAILSAYNILADTCREDLVIAGGLGWRTGMIRREVQHHRMAHRIHLIGYVDAHDKQNVYRLARTFVYPSWYEGFGFPPLEALACGIPVITSHATSLPEVVRNYGVVVDPQDAHDLARGIAMTLYDEHYRIRCAREGQRYARQFSWEKTANEFVTLIEEVLRTNHS